MNRDRDYILVAEDEPSMHRLIAYKLEGEGFKVDVATDGVTALDKLKENNYGAVILDLMLPQLDGMQVLKKLKEAEIKIPVLILSAKSQEQDILAGLDGGAEEYISKPFRPAELIARLNKVLEKNYA